MYGYQNIRNEIRVVTSGYMYNVTGDEGEVL